MRMVALATAIGSVIHGAHAQALPAVTDADLARAAQGQPVISEQEIAGAQQRHQMPSEAELARTPLPAGPRLDALPAPAAVAPIDLGALAEGYAAQATGRHAPGLATGPRLLIFVSFALPQPTLQRLVEQAARAHAVLVVRGLVNGSLRDTVARMQVLIGARELAFQIDPQAFDRYAIRHTPSFVLLPAGTTETSCSGSACAASDAYALAAGDVSLDYALEFIARRSPRFTGAARHFLKKLRG